LLSYIAAPAEPVRPVNLDLSTLNLIVLRSISLSATKFLANATISNDICLIEPLPLISSIDASLPSSNEAPPPGAFLRCYIKHNHTLCFLVILSKSLITLSIASLPDKPSAPSDTAIVM